MMFRTTPTMLLGSLLAFWVLPAGVEAANSINPGSLTSVYPTFENLAFDWDFSGDDNKNANVDIRYRPVGSGGWSEGMPLRRISAGSSTGTMNPFSWGNRFSGSLFQLTPGTDYQVELTLNDPNGGSTQQLMNVSTRPLPKLNVGTIVELPPGNHGTLFPQSGTPSNPRIYRSKFADNPATYSHIDLSGKHDVIITGITVNNPGGKGIKANNAHNYVIARNTINAKHGIWALSGASNGAIFDNVVQGETVWAESSMGNSGNNSGEGIFVSGPGNVIAYNDVRGFRDNISLLEDDAGINQINIDIHNNEIRVAADDAIEADFAQGNVRVMNNRITDAFIGISMQPSLGGPTYIMKNSMYNIVHTALKPYRFSEGDVVMHNTIVKVGSGLTSFTNQNFDHALFRNNLALGGVDVGKINGFSPGNSRGADVRRCATDCDFDYDAVGVTTDASPINSSRIYINGTGTNFSTVEQHGLIIQGINATDMGPLFPGVSQPTTKAAVLSEHVPQDLRPGPSSPVLDNAELIPGINDNFLGNGPDRGAYEIGQALPQYGPRDLVLGDYNYDYQVDADDLAKWVADFGTSVFDAGSDADGDSNGQVDGSDFLFWQRGLSGNASSVQAASASVPEPSTVTLFAVLSGACLMLRQRLNR